MLSLWIAVIGLTLLGALTLAVLLHRSSRLVRPAPSALSAPRLHGAALDAHLTRLGRELQPKGYRHMCLSRRTAWHLMALLRSSLRPEHGREPGAQYLRDNSRALEEALLTLQQELRTLPTLPALHGGGLRLTAFTEALLQARQGELSMPNLPHYLEIWQESAGMTEDELQALPQALRLTLLRLLTATALDVRAARLERQRGARLAAKLHRTAAPAQALEQSNLTPEAFDGLIHAMEAHGDASLLHELDLRLEQAGLEAEALTRQAREREMERGHWAAALSGSLRQLAQVTWPEFLERCDPLHRCLSDDPAGVYPRMDFESRRMYVLRVAHLARRLHTTQERIALCALHLAQEAPEDGVLNHIGWYLLEDDGLRTLAASLRTRRFDSFTLLLFFRRHGCGLYRTLLWVGVAVSLAAAIALRIPGLALPFWLLVCSEPWRFVVRRLLSRLFPARELPRLYLPQLEERQRTLIVLPVLLSTPEQALHMISRLSELRHGNPDPFMDYMLLGDFGDSLTTEQASDGIIIRAASAALAALQESDPAHTYLYFQRRRTYDRGERAWIGRERKRGNLESLNRLIVEGSCADLYDFASMAPSELHRRYAFVITLDQDTELPPGEAHRMVGALSHPLTARRQTASGWQGVSILQPLMGTDPETIRTGIQLLMNGPGGADPYHSAACPLYQRLCGRGSYQGKGIYDPEGLLAATQGWILPDTILSHDLLEGELAGCAADSTLCLYDGAPAAWSGWLQRLHRWTRGDWQLLPWLLPWVQTPEGLRRNPLSAFSRHKLWDNLRRSLLPIGQAGMLLLSALLARPGLFVLALLLPCVEGLCFPSLASLRTLLTQLAALPSLVTIQADALARALWRMMISHEKRLSWQPSAQTEWTRPEALFVSPWPQWLGAGALAASGLLAHPMQLLPLPLAALFAAFPLSLPRLEAPRRIAPPLDDMQRDHLLHMAEGTWRFFEENVTAETHFLPPDNVQIEPWRGPALRTSPTNIGLYLLTVAAAVEISLLDADEAALRLAPTLDTLEALPVWHGHPYNWYDLTTLAPLEPHYVSAVDSGNYVACLMAAAQLFRQHLGELDAFQRSLPARLDALAQQVELAAVYDSEAQLFFIGGDPRQGIQGNYYDLLASETRLLSFVAVCTRQVPLRHFSRLSRAQVRCGREHLLLSWSGTLFEYLLPTLLLPTYPGTLLHHSAMAAVRCQQRAAISPLWSVSESGYYAFDPQLNYQYFAFGLPAMAADPNARSGVYAPYAAALALPYAPDKALQALEHMRTLGMWTPHGFYESVDTDPARSGEEAYRIVRSHMAHHQGMLFCALVNALTDGALVRAFCRLPMVRAYTLLLKERAELRRPQALTLPKPRPDAVASAAYPSVSLAPLALPVEAALVSGGHAFLLQSASGLGVMGFDDLYINRFSRDASRREGIQFYLLEKGRMWQPFDPRFPGEVRAEDGCVTVVREHRELRMTLTSFVDPVDQHLCHVLELENLSVHDRTLEIADYFELALAPEMEQLAHPTYSDLFIETQPLGERGILAHRRRRAPEDRSIWLCHALTQPAGLTVFPETDRCAFLGRNGSPWRPLALRQPPKRGFFGAPVHPCVALRCPLSLHGRGHARLVFVTSCHTQEDAPTLDGLCPDVSRLQQRLALARLRHRVLMESLAIPPEEMSLLTRLVGAVQWRHQPHQGTSIPVALPLTELWALGLSGDRPMLAVFLARAESALLPLAVHFAAWQRAAGLPVELALVALEENEGPVYATAEELLAASSLRDRQGVALLYRGRLSSQQYALLHAAASLSLDDRLGSAEAQLGALRQTLTPTAMAPLPPTPPPASPDDDLLFPNGYGGFLPEGGYLMQLPAGRETPAPWCNYLNHPGFGTLCCESGLLFSYGDNSHLHRLTPWVNDPVTPQGSEYLLIEDLETGRFLSPTRLPFGAKLDCTVTHQPGVTVYQADSDTLRLQWTCFTDAEADAGCRQLRLRSLVKGSRRLRLHVCVRFVLGTDHRAEPFTCLTPLPGMVLAMNPNWPCLAFAAALDEGAEGFRMSPTALHGLWGQVPWGLLSPRDRREQDAEPPLRGAADRGNVAVLTQEITLASEGSAIFTYLTGLARQPEEIEALLSRCRQHGVRALLHQVQAFWSAELSLLTCHVPSEELALALNSYLPYQVRVARLWARAGLYQAGGAIGFRDQLQDMTALMYTHPEEVRRHLLLCASRQYEAGDVQHWWHPGGAGVRTRITDDRLFLPFLTAWYVQRTGDKDVLAASVPFLMGADIPDGQSDLYHTAAPTAYAAPLMEHCLRALRSLSFGPHGIPLMAGGDWNDGMNRVGGESVFLGFFLCRVLKDFAPLCAPEDADELLQMRQQVLSALEAHAWDGAWYVRAWFEDGQVLGSRESPACRIDLLSQCWAVLGGASQDRGAQALQSALTQLHRPSPGLTALLTPPFPESIDAGYISGYAEGLRENGGQYTHVLPWLIWALAELGQTDLAWELVHEALPLRHADTKEKADLYRLEPYFTAADIYTASGQEGRGGWSAYTGSAAWLYVVILEQLLGFHKLGSRVMLRPRVPDDWDGFALTLHVGRSTWHFQCRRDAAFLTVDGERLTDGAVELIDDGRIHEATFPLR